MCECMTHMGMKYVWSRSEGIHSSAIRDTPLKIFGFPFYYYYYYYYTLKDIPFLYWEKLHSIQYFVVDVGLMDDVCTNGPRNSNQGYYCESMKRVRFTFSER